MNRIIPKIFNGTRQLVISETFCCDPNQDVRIFLPITQEKTAELRFEFKSDADASNRHVEISKKENILILTLTNFLNTLGAALTKPVELNIGKDRFSLQIYGTSTGKEMLCLTLSLFKEESDNG